LLFSDVVGHSKELGIIRELLSKDRLPNSLIFSGPSGVGKKLVAQKLLKHLAGPLNVKVIGEEKPPTIEEVRELSRWLSLKPGEGEKKGAVIDKAELMRGEAANALLKTLEEPPEYGYIVLITSNENALLPTIRSRCRIFRFGRLTDANVELIMERLGVECKSKKAAVKLARGSAELALRLCEGEELLSLFKEFLELLKDKEKRLTKITLFSANFSKLSRDKGRCGAFFKSL